MSIINRWSRDSSFERRYGFIWALAAGLGAFCVYWFTLAPTIQGFDSAELTVGAIDLGFVHPTGYPLYMLVGHLFSKLPIGNIAFRLNLMSAFFGSLTIMLLYLLVYQQKRQGLLSLALVALFAMTPVFWSQAIRAEVYTLHTFLMVLTLFCWYTAYKSQRIACYAACFIWLGLGVANHLTTIWLWISILIVSISLSGRWKRVTFWGTLGGLLIVGILYLYFPIRSLADIRIDYIRPYFGIDFKNLSSLIWLITGSAFRCFVNLPVGGIQLGDELKGLGTFFLTGTLGFGIVFGALGWRVLRHEARIWNRLLTLYLLAHVCMFLAYHVVDKEVMILPALALVCIWSASGLDWTIATLTSRWKLQNSRRIYLAISLILFMVIGAAAALDWQEISLRRDTRIYTYASRILENTEPNTLIVNHWPTASVFDYIQWIEGKRLDVQIFNLDFYFLAIQKDCKIENDQASLKTWYKWLDDKLERQPLCFIEPLPPIPANLSWQKKDECWGLTDTVDS